METNEALSYFKENILSDDAKKSTHPVIKKFLKGETSLDSFLQLTGDLMCFRKGRYDFIKEDEFPEEYNGASGNYLTNVWKEKESLINVFPELSATYAYLYDKLTNKSTPMSIKNNLARTILKKMLAIYFSEEKRRDVSKIQHLLPEPFFKDESIVKMLNYGSIDLECVDQAFIVDPMLDETRRHIAQAQVLLNEYTTDKAENLWLCIAHLYEAATHCQNDYLLFSKKILAVVDDLRKMNTGNQTSLMGLLKESMYLVD